MQPAPHGGDCGDRMEVVRRTYDDGVERLFRIEHFAEVAITPGLRAFCDCCVGAFIIDVTQRDDILALHAFEIFKSPAARADEGDIELVTGPEFSSGSLQRNATSDCQPGSEQRGLADKRAARLEMVVIHLNPDAAFRGVNRPAP
jgi:hypothetical protein